jgi:hypothetical protein
MMLYRNLLFLSTAVLLTTFVLIMPAGAQTVLGNYKDWTALTAGSGDGKTCYMASAPTSETGKYEKRGDTFVLVTHRPAEKTRDVVEIRAGYTYKKDSDVMVKIGSHTFKLFTNEDSAWAEDSKTDHALTRAMIRGHNMVVKGTSSRGTLTTDTYSLSGFTAAHKAINTACGIK